MHLVLDLKISLTILAILIPPLGAPGLTIAAPPPRWESLTLYSSPFRFIYLSLMMLNCSWFWFDVQDDDGSPVSIFSFSASNAQDAHLAAARNGVKRLRTVSFPFLFLFAIKLISFLPLLILSSVCLLSGIEETKTITISCFWRTKIQSKTVPETDLLLFFTFLCLCFSCYETITKCSLKLGMF